MKVICTCGGTAGHVNPALALAGYMREKDAGTQILFVGAERGLERDLIAHTDYPFRTVNISSFHRSFRLAEIKHNLVSLKNLAQPMQQWMHDDGLEITEHPALDVREYIYDMATVMRAADLVICRAGASTLSELTALGVPAILVPSPNVTNHHQEKNAALLGDHGAALVLPEEGLDGKKLFAAAAGILNDPQRMETMSQNMAALGIPDATKRIYDTVMALLK